VNTFARTLRYLPACRRPLTIGLLAIPVARAFDLYIPMLIGQGIDELTAADDGGLSRPLSHYFLAIVVLAILKGVAKFAMRYYIVGASREFEFRFRADVYAHLLTLPPSYFQRMRTGDLLSRLSSDVEAVRMFLGPGAMYVAETVLFLTPAIMILGGMDGTLAALMALPLGLILWSMIHYADPIHEASKAAQERLAEMTNSAQEQFAGARVVRAFNAEGPAIARFEAASLAYRDQCVEAARYRGLNWVAMVGAKDLGMVVLIAMGCVQLLRGEISLGEFVVFNLYLGLLFWPMVALGWIVAMYQRAKASMERIEEVFATPSAIRSLAGAHAPDVVSGAIEIRGLSLTWPDGRSALRDIDLKVPSGTVVGITGPTGSGKSTLLAAIARLVEVPEGAIFVDGVDVTRWDVAHLRRAIGYVAQDAFLFADTLRSNLLLGREDASDEDLREALRTAQFDIEADALQHGLDTILGERGVTLSGGQRQRATIARALLKDPAILLLDDCLSAVDADTEARILRSLREALRGRTAIIVSHRIAALEIADHVVVLDEGGVAEQGAPAELRRRGTRYEELHRRQRMEAELEVL
jgi:ATP-binding cassette subfamily B multidrug efflux pump